MSDFTPNAVFQFIHLPKGKEPPMTSSHTLPPACISSIQMPPRATNCGESMLNAVNCTYGTKKLSIQLPR